MSTARGPNIHITELLKFQCSQLEFPGSKNMAPSIRATEGPDCDHTRVTPRSDKDAKLSLLSPNASSISPTGRAGHEQATRGFQPLGSLGGLARATANDPRDPRHPRLRTPHSGRDASTPACLPHGRDTNKHSCCARGKGPPACTLVLVTSVHIRTLITEDGWRGASHLFVHHPDQ